MKNFTLQRMYIAQTDKSIIEIEGYYQLNDDGDIINEGMEDFHKIIQYSLKEYYFIYIFHPDDKGEADFYKTLYLDKILKPSHILGKYKKSANYISVGEYFLPNYLINYFNKFTIDLLIKNMASEFNSKFSDEENILLDFIKNKLLSIIDIIDILE